MLGGLTGAGFRLHLGPVHDGSYFYGAVLGGGHLRGPGQGLLLVADVEEVETGEVKVPTHGWARLDAGSPTYDDNPTAARPWPSLGGT